MLGVDRVPDPDAARLVGRCDIEAGRRVLCNIDLAGVLGVDIRNLGFGQVTDYDRVSVGVEEIDALGVGPEDDGPAPLGPRQGGEYPPVLVCAHLDDSVVSDTREFTTGQSLAPKACFCS